MLIVCNRARQQVASFQEQRAINSPVLRQHAAAQSYEQQHYDCLD
jgi:hypothetical protein